MTPAFGHFERAVMILGAALCLATAAAAQAPADAVPAEALEVIEVTGERPGPGLWQVRKGEHVLYLLGTYTPLPRRLEWRSTQVEAVLDRAVEVIPYRPEVDADIGLIKAVRLYRQWRRLRVNPDDQTLAEVLPPELYARFEAARRKYRARDDDILELRPLLAANELSQAAIRGVGLRMGDDVAKTVYKLARQRKVPVLKLTQRIDDPQALLADLANINPAAERDCLAATVGRLDSDVASLRDRALAWAVGDIARLESQHAEAQRQSCWSALTSAPRIQRLTADFDRQWFAAVIRAVETHRVALAVTPIGRLLQKDGVLAQLAARGYTVVPP